MDTGVETGLETILVLTGTTSRDDIEQFLCRPNDVLESVADIEVFYIEETASTVTDSAADA